MSRHIGFREQPISYISASDEDEDLNSAFVSSDDGEEDAGGIYYTNTNSGENSSWHEREREARAADRLSFRLLAVHDDDSVEEDRILRKSLRLLAPVGEEDEEFEAVVESSRRSFALKESIRFEQESAKTRKRVIWTLVVWALAGLIVVAAALAYLGKVVGPPNQPVGPYTLIERQEGEDFFPYYSFYEGPDSVGSNGYLNYVGRDRAEERDILNVTFEYDDLDELFRPASARDLSGQREPTKKPFVYMGSAPTAAGPRDSIRLEGTRRFNRGLFM